MPWVSGVFESLTPPTFPAVPGTKIKSSEFNSVINDLISGLSGALNCAYTGNPLDYPVGSLGRELGTASHGDVPFGIGTVTPTVSLDLEDTPATNSSTAFRCHNLESNTTAYLIATGSTYSSGPVGAGAVWCGPFSGNDNSYFGAKTAGTGETALCTNGQAQVIVTDDGRLFAKHIHNNAGAVTGATNQYIASGTYTPTAAGVANCGALTVHECQWMRVGNVVTVSGFMRATPAGVISPNFSWTLTLPIASTLDTANFERLAGASSCVDAAGGSTCQTAAIIPDTSNTKALFSSGPINVATAHNCAFTFTYVIV